MCIVVYLLFGVDNCRGEPSLCFPQDPDMIKAGIQIHTAQSREREGDGEQERTGGKKGLSLLQR